MANLRAIRTRIRSVENTRQITKSMKMVAASKLRKTQGSFSGQTAFSERCGEILSRLSDGENALSHPLLQPRPECRTSCYVLMVGNRGLCGIYNQSLLRFCEKLMKQKDTQPYLITCGRWGKDLIAAAGLHPAETVDISDTPTAEEALSLAEKLEGLYLEGTVDEVIFVYQSYRSVLTQMPVSRRFLPMENPEAGEEAGKTAEQVIFEPDRESVLKTLLDLYIINTVHGILLEARTGEHAARTTAMSAAADNTEELIEQLTLELNHARQAAITTEISEIAGGAEALRKNAAGGRS